MFIYSFIDYYDRTCFFVLGLVAKTAQGVEILEELSWESVYDTETAIGNGLCVPMNLDDFLSVRNE